MMKRLVATAAVVLAIGVVTVVASSRGRGDQPAAVRVPVLAELFTSERCSSCPPADDLPRHLVRDQPIDGIEVIAISEDVDDWNRLGWRDPSSSEQFTRRQSDYPPAMGTAQIYTPQLVIDGAIEVLATRRHAVVLNE